MKGQIFPICILPGRALPAFVGDDEIASLSALLKFEEEDDSGLVAGDVQGANSDDVVPLFDFTCDVLIGRFVKGFWVGDFFAINEDSSLVIRGDAQKGLRKPGIGVEDLTEKPDLVGLNAAAMVIVPDPFGRVTARNGREGKECQQEEQGVSFHEMFKKRVMAMH